MNLMRENKPAAWMQRWEYFSFPELSFDSDWVHGSEHDACANEVSAASKHKLAALKACNWFSVNRQTAVVPLFCTGELKNISRLFADMGVSALVPFFCFGGIQPRISA